MKMSTFLSSTIRTARKEYICAACRIIIEEGLLKDTIWACTFGEKKALALARKDKWKIKVGAKYEDYRGIVDGRAYTLRMRPEILAIANKYDCWPEE